MKILLATGLCGLLFGLGLAMGGMTQPRVVLGFLDVTGAWNPRLLFVMGGAVLTTALGYWLILKRSGPTLADRFQLPKARGLDTRLLGGALIFGAGWGLAGYCPGPALASLGGLNPNLFGFVLAMLAGWRLAALIPITTKGS